MGMTEEEVGMTYWEVQMTEDSNNNMQESRPMQKNVYSVSVGI